MATAQQLEFQNRLREVMRKHRSMANGYTTRMRPDGLIVVKPRRRQSRISVRQVVIFLAAFILFKSFLIASLGETAYAERVAKLRQGSVVEQAGAFAMEADALSILVAQELRPLLHP